jgi:tetratricopeptide (TPR) repeat protein
MVSRVLKNTVFVLAVLCVALLPSRVLAQGNGSGMVVNTPLSGGLIRTIAITDLDLYIKGPNGQPIEGTVLVTLTKLNGEFYKQGTAKNGYVRLNELAQSEYNVQVVAPGFQRLTKVIDAHPPDGTLTKVTIQLEPGADGIDAATDLEVAALTPKAQKALGKAIDALRSNKPADARGPLETASRLAPKSAEVQYLFGLYSSSVGDNTQAKSYWTKAIDLYPQHFRALVALSEAMLRENKPSDALPYLKRAVRAEPSSWRAHALFAEAYLREGSLEEAIKQAERALELGHAKADIVQPVLAAALIRHGERDRAATILQAYLQEHPADIGAKKQLVYLQTPSPQNLPNDAGVASGEAIPATMADEGIADALPSSWLPPDIDEKVGSPDPGAVCALDDVVKNAGVRIQEFVQNVDRFAATESVNHESINKRGLAATPETVKFDYLVSIQEVKKGFFNVEEYRTSGTGSSEFPAGISTNGLPAMALIFHPYNIGSFDLTCEGLVRWNGGLAWQVHFRQRADRPNTMRKYRLGAQGRSYPVALKGRAWIAADSYQIVRMETQEIAPVPEIRLSADRTAIEYGPVHFKERNLDMWLPQSAEVFVDWRGRRFHRRHSFSKYLLFSVDEKQKIAAPKISEETPPSPAVDVAKPNP